MKRQILSLALITALSASAFADSYADKYFEGSHNPKLNRHEQKGLGIAKNYSSDGRMAVPPVPGDNGRITFAFGSDPSVVCAVMQVCDIALQPGEMINDLHAGDTARWNITPAISGGSGNERMHILVKPLDVGLQTTLFVATDRRTYHIRLKSHHTRYMPAVGFSYPKDTAARWRAIRANQARQAEAQVLPTGENIQNLDFNYTISGHNPSWKPLRVYNDGTRTIIQMPPTLSQGEASALLVVRNGENTLVNYRLHEDRYIVDSLFDEAIMITGVGRHQTKVVIRRSRS